MFRTKGAEKIKTHILCSITFTESRAVYELMWKIATQPDRPQMTIWRTRFSFWIPKATNLFRIRNTAFSLLHCLHERASMLRRTLAVLTSLVV
jgi:hypothetical protein